MLSEKALAAPGDVFTVSLLPRWPLLRAMQNTEYSHFIWTFNDFVDSDIREWGKGYFPCACDAPRAPDAWKGLQLADALDY